MSGIFGKGGSVKKEELRALQAPLKKRYRDDPQTALATLSATSQLAEGVSCTVQTGQGLLEAGLHPAAGGTGSQACSGEMLLEALVACAGVTLSAVATAFGIPIRAGQLRAEGDLDFRGTLGLARDVPVGFKEIRLEITLDTSASTEQIDKLVELTERYCVVLQTLRAPLNIKTVSKITR